MTEYFRYSKWTTYNATTRKFTNCDKFFAIKDNKKVYILEEEYEIPWQFHPGTPEEIRVYNPSSALEVLVLTGIGELK